MGRKVSEGLSISNGALLSQDGIVKVCLAPTVRCYTILGKLPEPISGEAVGHTRYFWWCKASRSRVEKALENIAEDVGVST